ncbi:MAG: hypothetical protein K6E67_09865 [Prevotella sp.]|nr:hypothetical protein [Prevotella sp.]
MIDKTKEMFCILLAYSSIPLIQRGQKDNREKTAKDLELSNIISIFAA